MDTVGHHKVVWSAAPRIARLEKLLASRELNGSTAASQRAWQRAALELLDLLDQE
jgi:hypothetical protein